jgi:hypothetical protein
MTALFAILAMVVGVGLAATVRPKLGGMLLLAGWLASIGALHSLGRSRAA